MTDHNTSEPKHTFESELRSILDRVSMRFRSETEMALKENQAEIFENDTRYDLDQAGVIHKGHFEFPEKYHTDRFYAFGSLLENAEGALVTELLASRLTALLEGEEFDYIISHGFAMSHVASQMATRVKRDTPVHLLHARGAKDISFYGTKGELKDARVVLLCDVVHTGALLDRLVRQIHREGGFVVKVACVVDLGLYVGPFRSKVTSLLRDQIESFSSKEKCRLCNSGMSVTYIDIDSEVECTTPLEPMTPDAVERHLQDLFGPEREFWDIAVQAKAMVRHKVVGKVHISPAIEVSTLMANSYARQWLAARLLKRPLDLDRSEPWAIVCAPRTGPAESLAKLIAELVEIEFKQKWRILKLRRRGRFYDLRDGREVVPAPPRVLVVDAGAARGSALKGAFRLLQNLGSTHLAAAVILDRTNDQVRSELNALSKGQYFGLVQVRFQTLRTEEPGRCPSCWKRALRESKAPGHGGPLLAHFLSPQVRYRDAKTSDRPFKHPLFNKVSLGDFQSMVFAVGLGNGIPTEKSEHVISSCLGQDKLHAPHRIALIETMSPSFLSRPRIQESLFALTQNNVPPTLLAAACTGLARTSRFDWLNEGWLASKEKILSKKLSASSQAPWLFLSYVIDEAKKNGPSTAMRIRELIRTSSTESKFGRSGRANLKRLLKEFDVTQKCEEVLNA